MTKRKKNKDLPAKTESGIQLFNFPDKFGEFLNFTAEKAFSANKKTELGGINIILIGDRQIKELNKKYRKVNRVTDVISFLINPGPMYGDIYIAKGRSQKQAKQYSHAWLNELAYLVIHGVLHLFGYTDYTVPDKKKMFEKQDRIFKEIKSSL